MIYFKYIANYLCWSGSLVKVAPPWVLPQSTIMAVPGGPDCATKLCCELSKHVGWPRLGSLVLLPFCADHLFCLRRPQQH